MTIPLFLLNPELALFIITLAGQSIVISLSGIIVIKLLNKRSAPARSLVCIAAITSLGLVLAASAGFYFSGISLYKKDMPLIEREYMETSQFSTKPHRTFAPGPESLLSEKILLADTEAKMAHTISEAAPDSRRITVPPYLFINIFGLIWVAGIMFQILKLSHGLLRVNSFRKSILFRQDTPFPEIIRDVAGRFRKDCIRGIYTSSLINSPIAMGLIKPVVVIPEKVFSTLSKNEMKSILLHEISHIYHHDLIAGVIKKAVLALHWWNPLVHLIDRYHEQAREEVADNHVLQDLAPAEYSRCIMDLVEKVCLTSNLPAASAMAGRHFNLRKRVEQILSKKRCIAMGTKLHIKITGFSICLVLTFGIAGLHARVSEVKNDDAVRVLQAPIQVIDTVSATREHHNITQNNIPEPKAVDEPHKPQSISKVKTTPHRKLSDKKPQDKEKPLIVMASVDRKALNKTEKRVDSDIYESLDEPALVKDPPDNIGLTQNKTRKGPDLDSATVPDNAVKNNRPEDAEVESEKVDIDTAIAELSRQIKMNNSDAILYLLRGNLHMDKQDYEQALNDYTKAIEINPGDAIAYNNRGQAYANMGEHKQAIKDYKQAIKRDPENIYAYINRGNAYYAREWYRTAIRDYTRAIEIDPEFLLAYINRGNAYYRRSSRSNLSNAIKDFSKALELNSEDADIYLIRGNSYYRKGEYMQAINDYNRALKINPDFINAYNNRGMAYEGMNDLDKSIFDISKAIEKAPEYFDAYINRGFLYVKANQPDKALADFSKAKEINPDSFEAFNFIADTYSTTSFKGTDVFSRMVNMVEAENYKLLMQLEPVRSATNELNALITLRRQLGHTNYDDCVNCPDGDPFWGIRDDLARLGY